MDTLDRLLEAARVELDEVGHEDLTIRTVATRAGVSSATAYNYFASRDHLFAELFWRHLATSELPALTGRSSTRRLQQTTRHLAGTIAALRRWRPRRPRACSAATRRSSSCGCASAPCSPTGSAPHWASGSTRASSRRSCSRSPGALLQTGMGLFTYPELADRLDDVVAVIMKGNQ